MKRLLLLAILSLVPAASLRAEDLLILRNQSEVRGTITDDDGEFLVIDASAPSGSIRFSYAELATINGLPAARVQQLRREVKRAQAALAAHGVAIPALLRIRTRSAAEFAEAVRLKHAADPPLAALAAFGLAPRGAIDGEALDAWRSGRRYAAPDSATGGLALIVPTEDSPDPFASFWSAAGSRPEALPVAREYGLAALDIAVPAAHDAAAALAGSWSDAELALDAVRNGLATAIALDAALDPPGLAPDQGDGPLGLVSLCETPPAPGTPAFLVAWRTFAGREGARFARTARFAGGWRLALRVLDDPPDSTEQILHPEKYFVERDAPSVVQLADLSMPRGAEAFGFLARGTLGEAMIAESFRHAAGPGGPGLDDEPSRRAAAGWDGDAWAVYATKDGALAFAWATTWDSADDAREFAEAAATAGALRNGRGKSSPDGTRIRFESAGARGVVEWKDRACVVVEGMPTEEAAAALCEAAWKGMTSKEELTAPLVTAPRDALSAALGVTDSLGKGWTSDPPHPEALGGRIERDPKQIFRAAGAFSIEIPEGWEARSDTAALVLAPPASPGLTVSVTFHRLPADAPPALVFLRAWSLARPQGDAPFLPYAARTADGRAWCQFVVPGTERRTHIAWTILGRNAIRVEAVAPLTGAPDAVKKALQGALASVKFER